MQKTIFEIGLKKLLQFKKLKSVCWGHVFLVILKVKKLLARFTKKKLQKTNQKDFRVEKVIKRRSDKLYVKWKGSDSSLNRLVDEKRHNINEWIFSRNEIFRRKSEKMN